MIGLLYKFLSPISPSSNFIYATKSSLCPYASSRLSQYQHSSKPVPWFKDEVITNRPDYFRSFNIYINKIYQQSSSWDQNCFTGLQAIIKLKYICSHRCSG